MLDCHVSITAPQGRQLQELMVMSGAAMTAEALPMVERLKLQPDDQFASPAPCLSWSGKQFGLHIHIVQNGEH